jgi:putative FmdB family regulatory protein
MPTYEYECQACAHRFEVQQAMRDAPVDTCPACGGAVRKLVTAGGGIIIRDGAAASGGAGGCSLETTGRTCCGRDQRCGKPPCGGQVEG